MEGATYKRSRRPPGPFLMALVATFLAGASLTWLAFRLGLLPPPAPPELPPTEPHLELEPAAFDALPGWREDDLAEAVPAFQRSCAALSRWPEDRPLVAAGAEPVGGVAGRWRAVCDAAGALPEGDGAAARVFFEGWFRPFAVTDRGEPMGLFTGYFEANLEGSRRPSERYRVPLYLRPPELIGVDLGRFRDDLIGRRIAGRLEGDTLVPFSDRAAIDRGALAGRGLELVWVDDPVDAFFLHVQGSGRVELAEGGVMRVGYAAQNGYPYVAIGRELVARGAMTLPEVSMPAIRHWLDEHPEEAVEVMAANPSYVFFRELPGDGPLGSLGTVLTPGRSLAIDRSFLPLGAPVWVETGAPAVEDGSPDAVVRRLLVAEDTGGAIRGPVRGDLYWGHGEEAAAVAGRMKHPGRMWLLLPR